MSFYKWYREVGYLGDDQNARAKIAYEAGAQSRQAEIDELQNRVDEALNKLCQLQYASAERVYNDVSKILKGTNQ